MRKSLFFTLIAVIALVCAIVPISATACAATESNKDQIGFYGSRAAYLTDYATGEVLYARNEDAEYPIASMVKIMTLNIVFDEIESGRLKLDNKIVISETAAGMGGSQMFLDAGKEYSVEDLVKGVIVVSANDASVALAETISGGVDAFITLMNEKATEYGMKNTVFVNVTGLPADGQHSTAKDVDTMMRRLLRHKEYYKYSSVYMENYSHPDGRITEFVNTNKLIRFYKGCDAGKTGFTNAAMFCLSASAKRDDTRVVATVLGAENSKARFAEITAMFNYAFANYKTVNVVEKGVAIPAEIKIAGANERTFEFVADRDIFVLHKKGATSDFTVEVEIDGDLKAPIEKGSAVGEIVVKATDGTVIGRANLITLDDIESRTYLDALADVMRNWFLGVIKK